MSHARPVVGAFPLAVVLALAACGSDSAPPAPQAATLTGTLAYVVTECRETSAGFFFNQRLMIRQGEHEPITALVLPDIGPLPLAGYCGVWARDRGGYIAANFAPLQRLAVSPDGSVVVFEITDAFSLVSLLLGHGFLPPEQTGFFLVRADGTGLRRLGPPSRQASFAPPYIYLADLEFSPNGRTITYPDLGPGPDGDEASQIVVQQLVSDTSTPVTKLPPASPASSAWPLPGGACCSSFLDDETVGFYTEANPVTPANPDGLNPAGALMFATVNADGSGGLTRPQSPVALPGSQIDPRFVITGKRPAGLPFAVPGEPINGGFRTIIETFFFDGGRNLLQLTNFQRTDTFPFGGDARERVFFTASADPLGTNPSNNCQIFSIASLGGDLRQLTQFHESEHATTPCNFSGRRPAGCNILHPPNFRDTDTGALIFSSTCDPFGTNPNGNQLFVMATDGTGLRQLTNARGLVNEADGTVIGELVDPTAYSGSRP